VQGARKKFLGVSLIPVVQIFGRAMAKPKTNNKSSHAIVPANECFQGPATER
jgi:hypothetical protein